MIPAGFNYHVAADLDEAVSLLREFEDAKVLAGGMSLIPLMKTRLAQPPALVDIGRIDGLNYVRLEGDRLHIGALTRHVDLQRSALVREHLPLLATMAAEVGDAQVRARGTIGGVMSHADSAGDYCTLAVMLDAEIVTTRRRIPAAGFFLDFMTTPLDSDEIVTEITFPVESGAHDYTKFRRRSSDWAIVGLGVQSTERGWRIGLTNMSTTVVRAFAAEDALASGADAAETARVLSDNLSLSGDGASAAYKKSLARTLAERALRGVGVS
jgi:Aerobic-type carbon monoxide dehydrogenase, middle subunit CoxM/CutM homologs